MRAAWLLLMTGWAAFPQTLAQADRVAPFFERKDLGVLKCQAAPLAPVLDFRFRFRAGYTVRAPLDQYRGQGHQWAVMVRIRPEGGGAAEYFTDLLKLPDIPDLQAQGDAGGGYLLSQGRYHASFLMVDDAARACRAEWNIEVPASPASVTEAGPALDSLTVLLHAAPVSPRLSKVQASDAVTLLGALSSLLDLAPAKRVRLVVFNLEQQKVIYQEEHFTSAQMESVRQAVFDLQLATIDYRALQNPTGSQDLLARLVDQELRAGNRSDAVVFLGPHARATAKVDLGPGKGRPAEPGFFYLQYERPAMRPAGSSADEFARVGSGIASQRAWNVDDGATGHPAAVPDRGLIDSIDGPTAFGPPHDSIDTLVTTLKGKTLVIRTPTDFAKAMKQIAPRKAR